MKDIQNSVMVLSESDFEYEDNSSRCKCVCVRTDVGDIEPVVEDERHYGRRST